jgi:SAM-dependent methyltransferase
MWRVPLLLVRERLAAAGRARVPEPMVMDEPEAVAAFDVAGATSPSLTALYDTCARAIDVLLPPGGRMLDLGSGSGVFLEYVARRRPDVTITGVDLSAPMRATARSRFERAGVSERVEIVAGDVTALADSLLDEPVDLVNSLNMLHQLPDATALGRALEQVARVRARFGSGVLLTDLARLRRADSLQRMLDIVDRDMPELARRDAIASEAAAFTVEELAAQLAAAGLSDLKIARSTPLAVRQMHWAPKHGETPSASAMWVDVPLPRDAARVARMQRYVGLPA